MKKTMFAGLWLLVALMILPTTALGVGGDTCGAATPVVIPVCDGTPTVDTPLMMATATPSGFAPGSCFTEGPPTVDNDRWYSWTNGTGVVQELVVTTDLPPNAGGDSQIVIFDDCVPTTELGCDDDGGSGFLSVATALIPPGASATIMLDGFGGNSAFDVVEFGCSPPPPPPPGEDCPACIVIPSLPFMDTVDISAYAPSPPPGSCNSGAATTMQNDVWYCITPTVDCDLDVVTDAGPTFDGIAAIHSGACGGLSEVDCIDDPEPQTFSTFTATGGTTYFIQIGDFGTAPGGGVTTIDVSTPSPGGCAVPVELQSFSVD